MTLQGNQPHGKTDIFVLISLSKKGYLFRSQSSDVYQRVDHCSCLFGIARPEIYDVAVRRIIAQNWTSRERSEKQRFLIVGQRHRDGCGRGANIADDGEDIILFNQPQHIGTRARWLVRIIERNEPQLASVYSSVTVCSIQAGEDTSLHAFAE